MSVERGREDLEAIALRYDRGAPGAHASVPRVVAKGHAWLAERILALARDHGVPVREDRDLVAMLSACELGAQISPETYAAVAELLAWLYRCNQELDGGGAAPEAPAQPR